MCERWRHQYQMFMLLLPVGSRKKKSSWPVFFRTRPVLFMWAQKVLHLQGLVGLCKTLAAAKALQNTRRLISWAAGTQHWHRQNIRRRLQIQGLNRPRQLSGWCGRSDGTARRRARRLGDECPPVDGAHGLAASSFKASQIGLPAGFGRCDAGPLTEAKVVCFAYL